jgi:hypothetical protein
MKFGDEYFASQLTTKNRFIKLNQGQESFDGSTGESSWIQIVRRALSRQTMSWNSKYCCN